MYNYTKIMCNKNIKPYILQLKYVFVKKTD